MVSGSAIRCSSRASGPPAPGPDRDLVGHRGAGDKVMDLEARWQADVLDARPDVVSILAHGSTGRRGDDQAS
ncbi:hypothetical protein GCM10010151_48810 [Actinoallomurus spadix]|uniref:Uncharacterized protein n=1 Tax=Actinoallomurus spadix TaxID=79912 RepID=A0ABP3GV17_9ACTN